MRSTIIQTIVLAILYVLHFNTWPVEGKEKFDPSKYDFESYHSTDEFYAYFDYLAQKYSDFVSVIELGKTHESIPIKLVQISAGDANAPAILVITTLNAFEWVTGPALVYTMKKIIDSRKKAEGTTFEKVTFLMLIEANPDGYEFSSNLSSWNKNTVPTSKKKCNGVAVARNWPIGWMIGASDDPCDDVYAGPKPMSEKETQAISKFIMKNKEKIRGFIELHYNGNDVLHPFWFDKKTVPSDLEQLLVVAKAMVKSIKASTGRKYNVVNAAEFTYPIGGSPLDWVKAKTGIKYTYAIFAATSQTQILETGEDIYAALSALADAVLLPK